MAENKKKILSVNNLRVSFKTDHGVVHAVRGVSFDLYQGETLCIVGESGSGKSVTSKTIMGILGASAMIEEGSIIYQGEDLTKISEEEFQNIRGKKIGMIFQDPLSSLNPIMRIGKQITEAMLINKDMLKKMYENKISKELVAVRNCQSKKKIEKQKTYDREEFFASDNKKKVQDALYLMKDSSFIEKWKYKSTETKKWKAEYHELLKKGKEERKEINNDFKVAYPPLAKALKKKEKQAKKEVKEYYAALKQERATKLADVNGRIASCHDASELEKLKEEKNKINNDFTAKTKITRKMAKERALAVMKEVGIPQPEQRFKQYPFEFSGGMRQRIVIAIALTANPDVLICDEPTTALDVTIQAQILELINRLKKERNMSIIFITHDLGVVANMADRVAVMYAGKIVEFGTVNEIFYDPKHPYTWALLSSIPDLDSKEKLEAIPGTPPYLLNPPKGDAFAARNKYAMSVDFAQEPPFFKISETHYAATWLLDERAPSVEKPRIVSHRIKVNLEKAGVKND